MTKGRLLVFFKGMAMGAADIVPGVSGGTIAFITGIYELLIGSIQSVSTTGWGVLRREGWLAAWRHINGNFLVTLFAGILLSVFSLAKLISYLLQSQAVLVWSFFFGLIIASVWHVGKTVKRWHWQTITGFVAGAALAWQLSGAAPTNIEMTPITTFFAGSIAICAMILPGISGSFVLLLLGMYSNILGAVKSFEIGTLLVFASGCVFGLLSIANLLAWAFRRFHDLTLAILTGFMAGALNKVWPWKEVLSYRLNSHGEQLPLTERNVMPGVYEQISGADPVLWGAILLAVFGFCLVLLIEKMSAGSHD
ncbi:MAG: DUF368 domain-containing protein [Hahellaceae bacterium]|nr:DUF368 domain-containing protein [Hahellaceae bacterium]